jgi:hypothetical protein
VSNIDQQYNEEYEEIPVIATDVDTALPVIGTYSEEEPTLKDDVRLLIGDTDEPFRIGDTSIRAALVKFNRNITEAAIFCVMAEMAQYSQMTNITAGRMSIDYRGKFNDSRNLLAELRQMRSFNFRWHGVGMQVACEASIHPDMIMLTNHNLGGELPYLDKSGRVIFDGQYLDSTGIHNPSEYDAQDIH